MANSKPIIPRADGSFDDFQKNFVAGVIAHQLAWNIPVNEITILQSAQSSFTTAYALGKKSNDRTQSQVSAKDITRAAYEKVLRVFLQRWVVLNPLISDGEKMSLNINPVRRTVRMCRVPDSVPVIIAMPKYVHQMVIHFNTSPDTEGSSRRGKPQGVKFCEVVYSVGTVPARAEECINRIPITHSPHSIHFAEPQKGQTVYFYARWVNSRAGEGGEWTNRKEFIIP